MCLSSCWILREERLFAADEVADRHIQRNLDNHMDVVPRRRTLDDLDPEFVAHLPDDIAVPQARLAMQNLEPAFGVYTMR